MVIRRAERHIPGQFKETRLRGSYLLSLLGFVCMELSAISVHQDSSEQPAVDRLCTGIPSKMENTHLSGDLDISPSQSPRLFASKARLNSNSLWASA